MIQRWTLAASLCLALAGLARESSAQSADWQTAVWREPQVRYLLSDICLNGGNADLYRKYAAEEKDPDSREAIRLWDSGARVINTIDFERKWIANKYGKEGKVMRVVFRGTERTITGNEVLLTSDLGLRQASIRLALAELTMGRPAPTLEGARGDANVAEALRRWNAGVRVANTNWIEARGMGPQRMLHLRGSTNAIDPASIRLNSDVAFPETNVRYFMADMALGGSIEFYRAAAERDHEMGCQEAVRRMEEGYKIVNLDEFERKKVDGKTVIARKGSNERISGMIVKLSSD